MKNKPAFPTEADVGMTLRDYFAAKAMQGIISGMSHDSFISNQDNAISLANDSYMWADAMLKAREE